MSVPDTGSRSGFFPACNPHLLNTSLFKHKYSSGLPRCNPLALTRPFLFSRANMWFTCRDHTVSQLDHAPFPDSSDLRGIKNQIRHQALNRQRNTPRHCHWGSWWHFQHLLGSQCQRYTVFCNTTFSALDLIMMILKIVEAFDFAAMIWITPCDLP